jgi:hypothetical protein
MKLMMLKKMLQPSYYRCYFIFNKTKPISLKNLSVTKNYLKKL